MPISRLLPACAAAAVGLLSACASLPPPAAPPASSAQAQAQAQAARPPAPAGSAPAPAPRLPGSPAPFAEVTKDARASPGFLPVWTKDEKVWLEIPAELLGKPFFLGGSLASGLGERGFLPGLMGAEKVVVLQRQGNNVHLIARNLATRAQEGTPIARAVAESYSDSLLASAPLAAAPHPERKSLLVEAQALLGGDLGHAQTALEAAFRLPYALDRANSAIERTRATPEATMVTVRAHFAVPRLPAPPAIAPGGPPPNPAALPNPPSRLPDARSLFLSFAYTLAALPGQPMRPRVADQRVGYFTTPYADFGNDAGGDRRVHLVRRWRLEKQDPAAEVSDPRAPIRAVVDRNVPERWRAAVREGILEWNKAFERAGLRNAIVVEQQPDDADWTSLEGTRLLAVRWFAMEGGGALAVGPSQADPRSGELLRGAAIIPENWVRLDRSRIAERLPRFPSAADALADPEACTYATDALDVAAFGVALLQARGGLDPGGPEAERFVAASLKNVVMHEVGHALGLRHNFVASLGVTREQLRDRAWVQANGVSNSVMDYTALNVPLEGEPDAIYHQTTLGAYDYWAIEFGYREFAPADEAAGLARIAGRSRDEAALAYATDEDADGLDPRINRFDLGDDPIAWAARQLRLARELWERTRTRETRADDDLALYRRNLRVGLATVEQIVPMLARHVGGVITSRQLAGAGQPLLTPLPAERQRAALDLLLAEVFASQSFRLDPEFMSRIGIDQQERFFARGGGPASPDFSLAGAVAGIQRGALDALMSEGLAQRLADAEAKVADAASLTSYADVMTRLADAVWAELRSGREVDSLRRTLQREHLKRVAGSLLRPAPAVTSDVRAVHRLVAERLEAELRRALAAKGLSTIARAHLAESQQTLAEALRAPLLKQGV